MGHSSREKVDLLELLSTLEEETHFRLGGRVCVLRLGRPWLVCQITSISGKILTVSSGHEYDLDTGLPNREAKGIQIQPLRREHVEYLMVLEMQKSADKINLRQLNETQWRFLLPAATRVLSLMQDLKGSTPGPDPDPHRTSGLSTLK